MKKKHRRKPEPPADPSAILSHLDQFGVFDKDAAAPQVSAVKSSGKRAPARHTIDLHGMTSDHAARRLRVTLERLRDQGVREVLVVHGRGIHSDPQEGPVLRSVVRTMLENECARHVRDFRTAPPREGGEGATLVYLR